MWRWVNGVPTFNGSLGVTGGLTSQSLITTGSVTVGASAAFSFTTSNVAWQSGTGSPENVVSAVVGSLYSRTDGGANTSLYIKQTGSGNTGWAAVTP